MDRYMVDTMHKNLRSISVSFMKSNQLCALYVTGSPDVKATPADFSYIIQLGLIAVTIDQGFTGSPVPNAIVRDIEAGAWPTDLIKDESNWHADRPTIYANRTDAQTLINEGWRKDMWVAWPNDHIPTKAELIGDMPALAKVNLIGAQIGTTATYDHSVIFDPFWPGLPPVIGNEVLIYPNIPGRWLSPLDFKYDAAAHKLIGVGYGTSFDVYKVETTDLVHWTGPVRL